MYRGYDIKDANTYYNKLSLAYKYKAQSNLNKIERFLSYDYAYEKQKSVPEFLKRNLGKF